MLNLCRCTRHIFRLNALGGNAKYTVPHPLDLRVDRGLPWQDDQDQLQEGEVLLQVAEHRLHVRHVLDVLAEVRLALDLHTQVARDAHQPINKAPERLWRDGLLRSETGDRPTSDGDPGVQLETLKCSQKLLS